MKETSLDLGLGHVNRAEGFSLSEVWCFIQRYRRVHGFSNNDSSEIVSAFSGFDLRKGSVLRTCDVAQLLRELGYQFPHHILQARISDVDIDATGFIDVDSLKDLIRRCREWKVVQYYAEDDASILVLQKQSSSNSP